MVPENLINFHLYSMGLSSLRKEEETHLPPPKKRNKTGRQKTNIWKQEGNWNQTGGNRNQPYVAEHARFSINVGALVFLDETGTVLSLLYVLPIDIYKKPRCPTSCTMHVKIRSGSYYNLRLTS